MKPASRRQGMTLAEVLVTLCIITTLVAPIFMLMRTGTLGVYRSSDETLATIYATDLLEIIRGAPFHAFLPNNEPMDLRTIFVEHEGRIPSGYDMSRYDKRFTIMAAVSKLPGYSAEKIRAIRVSVRWKDRQSEQVRERQLATFYTPPK